MLIRSNLFLAVILIATLASRPAQAETLSDQEAYAIAKDAYVYAYPLVLTHVTLQKLSNFAEPKEGDAFGPPNRFNHARRFPNPDDKIVIRENVDTLYSAAVLDLKDEPMVLSVPATDRFFHLPMLSLWTDVFAVPGTRTTGKNTARDFLVVGPQWKDEDAPKGLDIIKSPTRYVWIIGRTQTNGAADYPNVHKVQDQYKLVPLSAWGKADYAPVKHKVDPTVDMKTPPPAIVEKMDAAAFFARFAELLKDNPPNPVDYPMIHRLERIGFTVSESFDLNAAPSNMREAIESGYADGKARVIELGKKESGQGGHGRKGWVYTTRSGAYGVDYDYRAAVANFGIGENLPQDAIYPSLSTDANGRPLDGNNNYVLHFDKGQWPPVDAFWSVTAYDIEGYFIPNVLKRQAIGDRDKLVANPDGSLDLFIQSESPGPPGSEKEANWLPVGKAPFTLLMRLYSPRQEIIGGAWTPPMVKKAN